MHRFLILCLSWMLLTLTVVAQEGKESGTPTPVAPTPIVNLEVIPLSEIATRAQATTARLRELEGELRDDSLLFTLRSSLPSLTEEIDLRLREDSRVIQAHPDIEALRNMEARWAALGEPLPGWKRSLAARVQQLDVQMTQLSSTLANWKETTAQAETGGLAAEDIETGRSTVRSIESVQNQLVERRKLMIGLQSSVDRQSARLDQALKSLAEARNQSVSQLFNQDSPPMWSSEVHGRMGAALAKDVTASLFSQTEALGAYVQRQSGKLLGPLFLFLVLVLLLKRIRDTLAMRALEDEEFKKALVVFEKPYLTAALLAVMFGRSADPSAPRLLTAALGATILVPSIILLRRLLERPLWPILNILVGFFFLDQLRSIAAPVPLLGRSLLLLEAGLGIFFLAWFRHRLQLAPDDVKITGRTRQTISLTVIVASLVMAASAVTNLVGFVALSRFLLHGLMSAVYLGVIFYGLYKILEGLSFWLIRTRTLTRLRMVRRYGGLLRRRVLRGVSLLLSLLWALVVLESLSLLDPFLAGLDSFLNAPFGLGALKFTLARVLGFCLVIWLTILASRFARFALDQDVFPHLQLSRGVPYAMSMGLHYAILIFGIVTALAVLGVDTTKFTVVAGALSVGIGFGLQNIVNNFVSGLILLVDRPVNVGDNIKLAEHSGTLSRIGLRSSTLVIGDGSEVIVPNSDLINQRVVNWSQAGPARRVEIKVWISQETDPQTASDALRELALNCEGITPTPAPQVLVAEFAGKLYQVRVLAWVADQNQLNSVRSRLAVHLRRGLEQAGIDVTVAKS